MQIKGSSISLVAVNLRVPNTPQCCQCRPAGTEYQLNIDLLFFARLLFPLKAERSISGGAKGSVVFGLPATGLLFAPFVLLSNLPCQTR